MEETITFEELEAILKGMSDKEMRQWRFSASLKGIDLDKEMGGEDLPTLEDKINEVHARAAGMDPDTFALSQLGISVETVGEDFAD